jgi:hypothetical protein
MTLFRLLALAACCAAPLAAAHAQVVRCEVTDRTHAMMPAWIEYELRDSGLVLEIRDSLGAENGVDWVRGKVVENTERRMTLTWDVGMVPIGIDWPGVRTRVTMRLTRLPDGSIRVVGVPTTVAYGHNTTFNGRAVCNG